jgi:hypothetical protein
LGLGISILFVALGAALRYAVSAQLGGLSIQTIGVILMVLGVIGLFLSFIFWSSWGWGPGRTAADREDAGVSDDRRLERRHDDDIGRAA